MMCACAYTHTNTHTYSLTSTCTCVDVCIDTDICEGAKRIMMVCADVESVERTLSDVQRV